MPSPPPRRSARSVPPPIPSRDRRKRPSALGGAAPTVVDRALAAASSLDDASRADQLAKEVDANEPADAASCSYALGDLCERSLRDDARALQAYRRAFELDPSFSANSSALRRLLYQGGSWGDALAVIDAELRYAKDDRARGELAHERALVAGRHLSARTQVEAAAAIAPKHTGVLRELERVLAQANDLHGLVEVWERLADASESIERKISYWLEVARRGATIDYNRACRALDSAATIAPPQLAVRIARTRLQLAEELGPSDVDGALAALVQALQDELLVSTEPPFRKVGHSRELVALMRRQAQRERARAPERSWERLERAFTLAPEEPVLIVDLVELAAEQGNDEALGKLVQVLRRIDDATRVSILSGWCAKSHASGEHRSRLRALLMSVQAVAPGFILFASTAECEALAEPSRSRAALDLADAFLASARAAIDGTWLGPGRPAQSDAGAAVALTVQAAHLLSVFVNTPTANVRARDALVAALEAAPDHPALLEALTDLADTTEQREHAPVTSPDRVLRLVYREGRPDTVLAFERGLVTRAHGDLALLWRYEARLAEAGDDIERARVLDTLARDDTDPVHRRLALSTAARVHEREIQDEAALAAYRQLLSLEPDDAFAREAIIDLLRSHERWPELVDARLAEARSQPEVAAVRRALREAAWVLEVCVDDAARAAAVYDEWLRRLPDDRTALEGAARCRAAIRDHAGEVSAREAIAAYDRNAEATWLYARSLERASRYEEAAVRYRSIVAVDDPSVAATSAALALGDLAARGSNMAMRVEAAGALARRTTDARLGAALFESCGWMSVALGDASRAADAFAAALAQQPSRIGALIGAVLVAARRPEVERRLTATVDLAAAVPIPEVSAAFLRRAAAIAATAGDVQDALERVEDAARDSSGDATSVLVAAELVPRHIHSTDPFSATDRFLALAELFEQRGALAETPRTRGSWQLDRAGMLDAAGRTRDAVRVIADVLAVRPGDRRALAALRRIALRTANYDVWARASYALAMLCCDTQESLRLLREALAVFIMPAAGADPRYALAILRKIVAREPLAPERERLFELLRRSGDARTMIAVLSEQLSVLTAASPPRDDDMVPLLLERAKLLIESGHRDLAIADLNALLAYDPDDDEAKRLRSDLADDEATTGVRPSGTFVTVADSPLAIGSARDQPAATPRYERDLFETTTAEADLSGLQQQELALRQRDADPFGSTTVRRDLSALQEREREAAGSTRASQVRDRHRLSPPALGAFDVATDVVVLEPAIVADSIDIPDEREISPDDSDVVMLSIDELRVSDADDTGLESLVQLEREIAATQETAISVELRLEAGRLAEEHGDIDRAHAHYEAALLADSSAIEAMRGLRRIAFGRGALDELVRLVDAELTVAGARERDALDRYRLDLLMAAGEHDLARVAVGELLDRAPTELATLFVDLELAFLDGRGDELHRALELVGKAVSDPELRCAAHSAAAVVAAHLGDEAASSASLAAAAEADPDSPSARLGALRQAVVRGEGGAAGIALLDLAGHVEAEDPMTAAALALRAQLWADGSGAVNEIETLIEAAQLAARAAPRDPLVARLATENAAAEDPGIASHAFARWARTRSADVERAYAAARAAELEPARLGRLWAQVLELDPGDDYAAARLRAFHVIAGEPHKAFEVDLRHAEHTGQQVPFVRAADELLHDHQLDAAIDVLTRGRQRHPSSLAIGETLADALASAGRWSERATLLGELATAPGACDISRLRSALAWNKAAHETGGEQALVAALDAWDKVIVDDPTSTVAHSVAIGLARRFGDARILLDVLARAEAAERSPWAASSLALARARSLVTNDPRLAFDVVRDAARGIDDPRRTLMLMMIAAQRGELGNALTALEERADQLERAGATAEPATLRLRAAQIALDAGDPDRAIALLERDQPAVPEVAADLLAVARRLAGKSAPSPQPAATSFTRAIHDAEAAELRDDAAGALALYQRALEIRPTDPLASAPLVRIATKLRSLAPISMLIQAQLRVAEAMGDATAKADAYEQLAHASELLDRDKSASVTALEHACMADPRRLEAAHELELELIASARDADLLRLRERDASPDLASILDTTMLARHDDAKLADLYRRALALDPANRFAQLQLETILRRAGANDELAALYDQVAASCDDRRDGAALSTRAGETLVVCGRVGEAVQRFARAAEAGYLPAVDAWYRAALSSESWSELARAATRKAEISGDPRVAAAHRHFAGVVWMDKARDDGAAIAAFQSVLALDPGHVDAFVRLRARYEAESNYTELIALLRGRVEHEPDRAAKIALHATLAELERERGEREVAARHYRAILAMDPANVRAHAAIADLASERLDWQTAAEAVLARVPLEQDPKILRGLHKRLGNIYSEHDPAKALAAFQSARSYGLEDNDTLSRIADLAIATRDWDAALDACNRLVTSERDPEKLAAHFDRASTVFAQGLDDRERAEKMLELAVESAPTHAEPFAKLMAFHEAAGDETALRAHLDRIAGQLRSRIADDKLDGPAYRNLSRVFAVRAKHDGPASHALARSAAELAVLLGAGGEPERRVFAKPASPEVLRLVGARARDLLLAQAAQAEMLELLRILSGPIAKHVAVDLTRHGVRRRDRVQATDPVGAHVRDIATALGLTDVEVYVSTRYPHLMVAEPTSPTSLVLGSMIADSDHVTVRFAAGAALALAKLGLAIPARLGNGELGVLAFALVRLVRPELEAPGIDLEAVDDQVVRLRRLVPSGLLDQARPHVLAMTGLSAPELALDIKVAGLRAGLLASGSILPGIAVLAASLGTDLPRAVADPAAQRLIAFALSDDRIAP